jgi:hypothetical protein
VTDEGGSELPSSSAIANVTGVAFTPFTVACTE